jgi:hypothetical protein
LEHLVDTGQAFGSNWQEQCYLTPRGHDVFKDVQSTSTPPLEHHQVEASLPVAFVLERMYAGVPSQQQVPVIE